MPWFISLPVRVDFSGLQGNELKAKWFDPRTGVSFPYENENLKKSENTIKPPSSGMGQDWVLVVE